MLASNCEHAKKFPAFFGLQYERRKSFNDNDEDPLKECRFATYVWFRKYGVMLYMTLISKVTHFSLSWLLNIISSIGISSCASTSWAAELNWAPAAPAGKKKEGDPLNMNVDEQPYTYKGVITEFVVILAEQDSGGKYTTDTATRRSIFANSQVPSQPRCLLQASTRNLSTNVDELQNALGEYQFFEYSKRPNIGSYRTLMIMSCKSLKSFLSIRWSGFVGSLLTNWLTAAQSKNCDWGLMLDASRSNGTNEFQHSINLGTEINWM
jgi:hypothetical protein